LAGVLPLELHPQPQKLISYLKMFKEARHWWLTSVILATKEAEIRRIAVQSQARQIVLYTLTQKKKPIIKKGLVE
jgi:hypothetical protein